jgi:DNA helicase-2/ATP-dependent DNA helicase PcrA
MSAAHLEKLNREQRLAVEHGIGATEADANRALLVLAGAGTGKMSTLAHRVVHLVLNGADPRRILLMTFSRRAAAEMTRRVQRIANAASGRRDGSSGKEASL